MRRFGPMGMLVAVVVASSVFLIAQVAAGAAPSDEAQQLTSFGLALAFVLWVMADARRQHRTPCYDFGFLVAVFFPCRWSGTSSGRAAGGAGSPWARRCIGLMLLPWVFATVALALRFRFL